MWTTKRVLLLLTGFALFFSTYLVYAYFLGGLDGLPPLPAEFLASNNHPEDGRLPLPPKSRQSEVDQKLQLAFPGREDILISTIKLELKAKNLILATGKRDGDRKDKDFEIVESDGRMKLTPFRLAMFGKPAGDGNYPEINTIESDVAYLTFDQPIHHISDIGKHKIVACELAGNVMIKNNRRTVQQDDDLSLFTQGPLYYEDGKRLIWTTSSVRLLDTQSKPEPTTITAMGMDLHLGADPKAAAQPQPNPRKAKTPTISGVEKVCLRSTVEMHLWLDAKSGFLAGGKSSPSSNRAADDKPAAETSTERPKVVIKTEGPFAYDITADRARFDIPARRGRFPEKVTVTRLLGPPGREKRDELTCDRLELQFQRKNETAPARGDRSVNVSIQNAHATGQEVTLKSEEEGLDAIGNDFFYDAQSRQSILKGAPEMVAMKDGHEIFARELCLTNAGQKNAQQAKAKGPGRIAILGKGNDRKAGLPANPSGKRTLHARWKDELEFGKDGDFDCLTLTGTATFEDQENGQHLQADRLKVWLQKGGRDAASNGETQRVKPHHLEAAGHVAVQSEELHVQAPTEHLVIWFKDEPARTELPPVVNRGKAVPDQPAEPPPLASKADGDPESGRTKSAALPSASPTTQTSPRKNKKPLVLSARSVETIVVRRGDKSDLERLRCEGDVRVRQEPASPEDKGVDIRGATLHLNHDPAGSTLVVTGNLAQVQLNKISIMGPEVNIDQKTNKAWVHGIGAMQMLTTTTLEGEKLAQPTEMTIHWNKDMLFNGQYAVFHGGVQAEQNAARLVCQEMQVFLDRPVSFKEGEKGGQSAKVKELVCDKSVRIEDRKEQDFRLLRYSRLTFPAAALNNEDGILNAPGPGVVHILQPGVAGEVFSRPTNDPAAPKERNEKVEMKLTRISYLDRLYANNGKRTASFYGNVEVVHLPADDPDLVIDVDHPPPGCLYLRCEQLKVFSHRLDDGRTSQEMEATRKVVVQSQEFWGVADKVKYDEIKDLVIFEGGDGGKATLYRVKTPGADPEKLTGKKIFYWRKTNEVKIESSGGMNVVP